MSYAVKEIFYTLQGEGAKAGPAGRVLPLRRLQSLVGPGGGPGHQPSAASATPTSSAPTAPAAAASPTPRALAAAVAAHWPAGAGGASLCRLHRRRTAASTRRPADRRPPRARVSRSRSRPTAPNRCRPASTGSASAPRRVAELVCRARQRVEAGLPAGGAGGQARRTSSTSVSTTSSCNRWTALIGPKPSRPPSPTASPTPLGA